MSVFTLDGADHILVATAKAVDFHHWSSFQDRHALKAVMRRRMPKLWEATFGARERMDRDGIEDVATASGFAFSDGYALPAMGIEMRGMEILGAIICTNELARGFRLLLFESRETYAAGGRDFAVGIVEIPLVNGWDRPEEFFLSNKDKDIVAQLVDYAFGKSSYGERGGHIHDLIDLYDMQVVSDMDEIARLCTDPSGKCHVMLGTAGTQAGDHPSLDASASAEPRQSEPSPDVVEAGFRRQPISGEDTKTPAQSHPSATIPAPDAKPLHPSETTTVPNPIPQDDGRAGASETRPSSHAPVSIAQEAPSKNRGVPMTDDSDATDDTDGFSDYEDDFSDYEEDFSDFTDDDLPQSGASDDADDSDEPRETDNANETGDFEDVDDFEDVNEFNSIPGGMEDDAEAPLVTPEYDDTDVLPDNAPVTVIGWEIAETDASDDMTRASTETEPETQEDSMPNDQTPSDSDLLRACEALREACGVPIDDLSMAQARTILAGKAIVIPNQSDTPIPLMLSAIVLALQGKQVHIVAKGDASARLLAETLMGATSWLGLFTGFLYKGQRLENRSAAYGADIICGTANEIGCWHLRSSMGNEPGTAPSTECALVEGLDGLLLEHGKLSISLKGDPDERDGEAYKVFATAVRSLTASPSPDTPLDSTDYDCVPRPEERTVHLTKAGIQKVMASIGEVAKRRGYDKEFISRHMRLSLDAKFFLDRDIDYVVTNREIRIIDKKTGKVLNGPRYSNGLHQAVEAKEGVPIHKMGQTIASVTVSDLFKRYDMLAGTSWAGDPSTIEGLGDGYGISFGAV